MAKVMIKLITRDGKTPAAPFYATSQSAGVDLSAFLMEPVTLMPGDRYLVPTGVAVALPQGTCGFVMARSGLSLKNGVCLANGVGLIDSDYRGELCVPLMNCGREPFTVENGMRIAQMCIMRHETAEFQLTDDLGSTARGENGFGSTGVGKKQV